MIFLASLLRPSSGSRRAGSAVMNADRDEIFMRHALAQAARAGAAGEVPVGAVLIQDEQIIASGHNQPMGACDPSAHAEIVALRAAGAIRGTYRFPDAELFVTLEPCTMCAGALIHARVARVVYAAADPKTGAAGSALDVFSLRAHNHRVTLRGGVLAGESAGLLREFFDARR